MNNLGKFKLFRWQFGQLWKINLLMMLVIGTYVVIRVVPFSSPELFMFICVTIHSGLVVRKLIGSSNASNFVSADDLNRDQIWWPTLFASLASGLLVCGTLFLLMLLQVRSAVQEHWLVNPYFPLWATNELWVPTVWMLAYLLVIPLLYYAVVRSRQPWRNRLSGWATMLVGLGLFGWYTLKMAMGDYTSMEYLIFASCHVPGALVLIVATWRLHRTMELAS